MKPIIKQAAEILIEQQLQLHHANPLTHSDEYYTREGAPKPDDMKHRVDAALKVFEQEGVTVNGTLIKGAPVHRALVGLTKTAAMIDREIGSHRQSSTHGGPQATIFAAKMIIRAHGHALSYSDPAQLAHFFEGVRGFMSDQLGKFALSYAQPAKHETSEIEPAYLTSPKIIDIAHSMVGAFPHKKAPSNGGSTNTTH